MTSTLGNFQVGVVYALPASEYAHAPTILAVICLCVLFSAVVGRWWTLALPVVFACAVFALMPIEPYYERTPEDAMYGLVLAIGVLVLVGGLVAAIYLYQSPSHDFRCDALKRIERQQAGKAYRCWWPD